jgi:hypothetical protein
MDQLGVEGVEEGRESGDTLIPRRFIEVVVCEALGNHIFTVNSGGQRRRHALYSYQGSHGNIYWYKLW